MNISSPLVAAVLTTTMLFAPTSYIAPPPPTPHNIPQVMWDALWDHDNFTHANRNSYINSHDPMSHDAYMFRTTNHYKVNCDTSGRSEGYGFQVIICRGQLPLPGSQKYLPLSPIKSTKLPTIMQNVAIPMEPVTAEMERDQNNLFNAYGKPIQVLPVGQKLIFPKENIKDFKKAVTKYYMDRIELYNRRLVCVVPDAYSFGCIRSDNRGFYFDLYGSHLF